ncbi:nitrous oxide reductase accessory protein NosL [Cesiribacter sp. SM1]|uniref:nitrous oxide reductase accessory protein NosL n=1 Tax=Cesiribacter sp. SM1 TaxID=2861196 RepID=UPI001CD1EF13|nr:nitrous oxide reductase accessory protein NosL [Cesiribacter sp. SM1]
MSQYSRILVLLGALSMSLLFFFPMWKIYLQAPQYPEGLEMHIWVNKIAGNTEFTLQNFNILNHYIGMKPIEASSFKELEIMPIVVYVLMVFGLLAALFRNKYLVAGWLGLLAIAGTAGLVDFYLWLVDFGTNLDPNAPIKIPGMTYIPPLIGPRQLLNFHALSLPAMGSLGLAIPMILAGFAVYIEFFSGKKLNLNPSSTARRFSFGIGLGFLFGLISLTGCSPEPQPIAYGQVGCEHCKMTISDPRYGAEIVTKTGKAFFFDSIECMADYLQQQEGMQEKVAMLLVTDFNQPETLLPAEQSLYLQSEKLPSPMGMFLTAVATPEVARDFQQTYEGRLLNWSEVLQAVKSHEKQF